jgi:hypothetical protein
LYFVSKYVLINIGLDEHFNWSVLVNMNGELTSSRYPDIAASAPWTIDAEGNIHFMVTSNGMVREQWEFYFESSGFQFSGEPTTRQVLRRAKGAPTCGITYHVVVWPSGNIIPPDRGTKEIRVAAEARGWQKPHWEVACLMRQALADEQLEEMGLRWITTMHQPIVMGSGGRTSYLLGLDRYDEHGPWLNARTGNTWDDRGGFAFIESQDSFQIYSGP